MSAADAMPGRAQDRTRLAQLIAILTGATAFWVLRVYYWHITTEVPFSDMAGYLAMGRGVYERWDFVWDDFWWTFKGPGQPLLIAASWWFAGGESLRAWQYAQTLLLFVSVVWLAREVAILTHRAWISIALLWVIALSKSSVFWTLKYAQETTSETATYICVASALWALRNVSRSRFAVVGLLVGFAILCRPQSALYVFLFPLFAVLAAVAKHGWQMTMKDRRLRHAVVAFACGTLALWSPWVIRSYALYNAFLPLTTQGPYAVLWELGDQTVEVPGHGAVSTEIWSLLTEAPIRFNNDYEASRYASAVAWAWIKQNQAQLPSIVIDRLKRSIVDDGASGLTRVSRTELLPGWANAVMIDKDPSGIVVIAGILGLLVIPFRWGTAGCLIPAFVLVPWIATASMVGWARYFEPSLPMVLFGNVIVVSLIESVLRTHVVRRDRAHADMPVSC